MHTAASRAYLARLARVQARAAAELRRAIPSATVSRRLRVVLDALTVQLPVKQLPGCWHYFHVDCVEHWLARNNSCPLCRARLIVRPPCRLAPAHQRLVAKQSMRGSPTHYFSESLLGVDFESGHRAQGSVSV